MPVPPAIDPRLLAAEIEAAVAKFNRLANLAAQLGLTVEVEARREPTPEFNPPRAIVDVRVIAPL